MVLIEPDQTISWSNDAALAMHGVEAREELGGTGSEYRSKFRLSYRNKHLLPEGDYPVERVVAGKVFDEVTRADRPEFCRVH